MSSVNKKMRIKDRKVLDEAKGIKCSVPECSNGSDPAHIRTKGSGGDDIPDNLIPLCRGHHTEQGMSWVKFIKKYPHIGTELESKGWEIQNIFGVNKLVRKS
jgi:hypothetical protein